MTQLSPNAINNNATVTDILGKLAQVSNRDGCLNHDLACAWDVLRKLPTVYYHILRLRYIQGLTMEQVGNECGCGETTIRLWHEHALSAFARQLEADGVAPISRRSTRPSIAADQFQLFTTSEITDDLAAVAGTNIRSLHPKKNQR